MDEVSRQPDPLGRSRKRTHLNETMRRSIAVTVPVPGRLIGHWLKTSHDGVVSCGARVQKMHCASCCFMSISQRKVSAYECVISEPCKLPPHTPNLCYPLEHPPKRCMESVTWRPRDESQSNASDVYHVPLFSDFSVHLSNHRQNCEYREPRKLINGGLCQS